MENYLHRFGDFTPLRGQQQQHESVEAQFKAPVIMASPSLGYSKQCNDALTQGKAVISTPITGTIAVIFIPTTTTSLSLLMSTTIASLAQ